MMKAPILTILILCLLTTCKEDRDFLGLKKHADLTRNIPYQEGWLIYSAWADSVDRFGQVYFTDLDKKKESVAAFYLESINKKNTIYKRSTYNFSNHEVGYDTIEVPLYINDSITFKIPNDYKNGTVISYSKNSFVGWYNKKNNRIEGYLYPVTITMRCPYCPGKVYFTYTGKVPARIEPFEY